MELLCYEKRGRGVQPWQANTGRLLRQNSSGDGNEGLFQQWRFGGRWGSWCPGTGGDMKILKAGVGTEI